MDTPVLFLIFNRPDVTSRVFEAIRKARPKHLFVAADGPRANRESEAALCEQTRAIATEVDWPCEVKTLFRDENLGCRQGVSGGISWFFEHVEEGIILEDDCLPEPSFFSYCGELLERHRDDARVMCVSGYNSFRTWQEPDNSYTYSSFPQIWGWATWRRAWQYYDFEQFQTADFDRVLRSICEDPRYVRKAAAAFRSTASGDIDTWDFVWAFCLMAQGGLTCMPHVNLVSNVGFGPDATHTTNANDSSANRPSENIRLPLVHPRYVCRDPDLNMAHLEHEYGVTALPTAAYTMSRRWQRLKHKIGL